MALFYHIANSNLTTSKYWLAEISKFFYNKLTEINQVWEKFEFIQ